MVIHGDFRADAAMSKPNGFGEMQSRPITAATREIVEQSGKG
jgi:hypothetical protein